MVPIPAEKDKPLPLCLQNGFISVRHKLPADDFYRRFADKGPGNAVQRGAVFGLRPVNPAGNPGEGVRKSIRIVFLQNRLPLRRKAVGGEFVKGPLMGKPRALAVAFHRVAEVDQHALPPVREVDQGSAVVGNMGRQLR